MPWQDNSGKGGGKGPVRGPWGQPPRPTGGGDNGGGGKGAGRGGEPPDLDEILKASKLRLKRAFPRGVGGGSGGGFQWSPQMGGLVGVGLLVLWIFAGIYQVGPQEQGVTTTFGKYAGITGPGLHWRAPMIQGVKLVPVDKQQTATINGAGSGGSSGQENLMLTSDRNIVDINFTVDWKISRTTTAEGELPKAAKFIFNIEEPEAMVKAVAEAAMRETEKVGFGGRLCSTSSVSASASAL